jgi:putative membrane protein
MKKLTALVAALAVAASLSVPALGGAAGTMNGGQKASKIDQRFLLESMQTDLYEIKGGEAAQKQGSSSAVKKFGELLARNHSMAYANGKKVAMSVGATVPKKPSAKMTAELQKVGAMKGAAFDKAFAKAQIVGHEAAIFKANNEIEHGSDKTVVALASKDQKMYEMHLKDAERVMRQLSGMSGGGGE